MFKRFLILFSCILFFAEAQTVKFTILTFNDVYDISPNQDGLGGMAEMATLLNQERAKTKHHVTTVNGDFLSPSLLSTFDRGKHAIELFNAVGVDMVVLGNHEFDFGPELLQERLDASDFDALAANVYKPDGSYFTGDKQIVIHEVEGVKIGFFGLVTVETPQLSSPGKNALFAPLSFTAKQMVQKLKEQGADVIVALTHLLMEEDRLLAKEVPEIDLILGGHDHDPITWYEGKTFIHKTGCNAHYLARIDLIIDKKMNGDKKRIKVFPSWRVILNKNIEPHPEVAAQIALYQQFFESIRQEPLAVVFKVIDTTFSVIRTQETAMGDLIADAIRASCSADAVIISSGIIRGDRIYKPGSVITLRDLMEELPFSNSNILVEISGTDILAALENGVSQFEGKAGRFPQVSGIQFFFDLNRPPGSRITGAKVNGEPLISDKLYKVATVDYMLHGGDGYNSFKNGRVLIGEERKLLTLQTVLDYIKLQPALAPETEDRIVCTVCRQQLDDNMLPEGSF